MIDIQSSETSSSFDLNSVGVMNLKYPFLLKEDSSHTQTVTGVWKLGVRLPKQKRGTHMSRFVSELDRLCSKPIDLNDLHEFAQHLKTVQETPASHIYVTFDWFRKVAAPVSKQEALMDYKVSFSVRTDELYQKQLCIEAPAKALCPCSKAISDRGAHNQRSLIKVELMFDSQAQTPAFVRIIETMETSASSPVYPLLKREDEKYVTEYAYDHPSFVEDISRNIAEKLYDWPMIKKCTITAVNQESIHNHDCFSELSFEHR